jgi:hypothetical protein
MATYLAIKNWALHQHYKDRRVPWIKLYAAILDDPAFLALSEVAQAQLVKLWALVARMGHPLPNNAKLLAQKILTPKLRMAELLASGFVYTTDDPSAGGASIDSLDTNQNGSSDSLDKVQTLTRGDARSREVEVETAEREKTAVVGGPRAREGLPPAVRLAAAANKGLTAALGESPHPLLSGHVSAVSLAEWVQTLPGDALAWAESELYAIAKSLTKWPSVLGYFRRPLEQKWAERQARFERDASGAVAPPAPQIALSSPREERNMAVLRHALETP